MAKKSFDELYKEAKSKKSFDELYKEAPENTARKPQSSAQPGSFNNVNPSNNALGAIRDAQNKLSAGSRNTSAFDVAPKPITLNSDVEAYRKQTFDNYQARQRKQAEEREEIRNKYSNLDKDTMSDISLVSQGREADKMTTGLTGAFVGISSMSNRSNAFSDARMTVESGNQAYDRLIESGYSAKEVEQWVKMYSQKESEEFNKRIEDDSKELAKKHPVLASAGTVALNVATAPVAAASIIDDAARGEIDTNNKMLMPIKASKTIRSTVSEDIAEDSKAGAWLYNVGMSGADSLVVSWIPGGAAILATNAAVDTTIDLTERGVDSKKALVGGIAAGAFEAIFESISIGRFKALQEVSPKGVKDIVRNLAKSIGVNASEETLTEAANIVYDTIAHGDLSNYNLMVENLKSQGMKEPQAKKEAIKALVGQVLEAGAAGAVMGGAFTAIGTPIGYARNASTAKAIGTQIKNAGEADAIIAEGLAAPKGTAPYLAAQQAKKKSDKGKSVDRALGVTAMEIGNYISDNTFETKGRFAKATTIDEVGEIYESQKRMYEEASMTPAQRKSALRQLEAEHREAVDNLYYSGISGVSEMREAGKAATTSPEAIVKTKMPTIGRDEDGDAVLVSEITDISDGVITVKTSDGGSQELDIKDVKGINAQELWTSAAEMFTDASSAQAFIDNYNGGSVHEYSKAFSDYYHLAATGMSLEQIQETDFLRVGELSETAQIAAVEAGKKAMSFKMGVVDLTTRAKTKAENLQMNILDNVGNHIGMNIVVVDTLEEYEGFQKVGSNQIVVALDSSRGAITRTASHETWHYAKQELGDEVKHISDFVIDTLRKNKGSKWVNRRLKEYEKQGYKTKEAQIDELVADSLFDAFTNERAVKEFASKNGSVLKKISDHIKQLVADIKNILNKLVATGSYAEIKAWQSDLESLEKLNNMFLDVLDELAERKGDESSHSQEKKNTVEAVKSTKRVVLSNGDISAAQSIGRKSINSLSSTELNKLSVFAKKYWSELGIKSPFFRAWFGDWRENDITPSKVIKITKSSYNTQTRSVVNKDMSKDGVDAIIKIDGAIFDDSMSYAKRFGDEKPMIKLLSHIDEIISNAVYLDTHISEKGKANKKGSATFMHYLYCPVEFNGAPFIAKITIEEYDVDSKRRAYNAQRIKMSSLPRAHFSTLNKDAEARNIRLQDDEITVADLFSLVKQNDKNFSPNPASKVVNPDGTPRVMYHGTTSSFTAFDKKKAKSSGFYGRGFYFTESESHAGQYGNAMAVYLDIKNPLEPGKNKVSKEQLRKFLKAVAENEDYDIWNYGTEDISEIVESIYKNDAFAVIQDVNATTIGNFAEALELFNSVNGTNFDGIITPTETVVYEPTQIKSATDNIGTFDKSNPDIRYSTKRDTDYSSKSIENGVFGSLVEEKFEIQDRLNKLTKAKMDLEKSDEYAQLMSDIFSAKDEAETEIMLEKYNAWMEKTKYSEIVDEIKELQDRYSEIRKAIEEDERRDAISEERKKIEKSGLSEADYYRKLAVKEFGYTPFFYDAGYLLPNGNMLNFSGEKGKHFGSRGQDHRAIGMIYATVNGSEAMLKFMGEGNIRVMAETPGLDISSIVEPTPEQYRTIKRFVREIERGKYFAIDITDSKGNVVGTYEYENYISADRVVNDIKYYFKNGSVRESSNISDFLYSHMREPLIPEEVSDYILDTKEYREILDIVDERFELAGRKELSPKAIDRLAGNLLKKSKSNYNRELLTERLTALFDYIANSRDVSWEDVTSIAAEISKDILKQSQTLDRSMQTEFADVLKLMKESKVFISPELKAEIAYNFGSYEAFRKMLGNKLKVTVTDSSAVPLDVFWRELSEARPDMFESGVNYLDMPKRIVDFFEMTQPQYINPYNIEMDMDEAAFDFALQIYEEYFSIPEVVSESKKHSREIERLKGRYNAKIKEIHSTYRERISRIRKEKNNKIEATKELYRQRHEAYREKRNETQAKQNLRKSIYKISKSIIDKLVKPTDAKYIPQELVAPITEFAKIITEGGTFSFKQTQRLIDALQIIEKKNLGESLESIADDTVITELQELRDLLDGRAMVNLTSYELKRVRDIAKSFRHLVYTTNRMHAENIRETVSEIGESFFAEMKDKKTGSKRFATGFQRGLIKPVTFFDMLESPTMQRVYQNLRNGESEWYRTASEIKEKIASLQEKYGYSQWKNKSVKIELERGGKTVVFTMEEALSIYATSKRKQGLMHLLANGFVRQEEEYQKLLKVLKKEYKKDSSSETPEKLLESMKGKATTLTINDIQAINEAIDAEARQYADDFVAYMSKDMADLGNQTALKLKGRKIFGEDYYFPIVSDPNHLHFAAAKGVDARLKNMSMTKATVENAKNSIVIGGFTDTAAKHCLDMAMYSAFTLPLEDFTRVLNYGVDATEASDAISVRQEIERVYGAGAVDYIKTLLSDINGGVVVRGAGALNKFISMTKKDAVIGSLSVAIQQPSAIGRAFAYINPRFFFAKGTKNSWEELKKYAPVAGVKEMGYFDTNIGKTALEWVTDGSTADSVTALDKVIKARDWTVEKLSAIPAKMDEITWSRIWAAVKAETHHKHPEMDVKSEEFLKLAGERFTYVIDRTQVYDSVFARSEWMRAKDSGVKQMMAFMNEPLVSLNMLYEATVMKQDSKGAKAKFVMKTLTSVLFASALNSALKSIVQTMRDDDDDESALEQYLSKLVENFVYEPLGWIPLFGDVLDGIRTGFDSQNMSESALSTILDSFVGVFKEDKSDYEKIKAICGAVGLVAGVPIKNVWRDFEAVKNAIKSSALGIKNIWGDESGVAEALSKFDWLFDEGDIKVLEEGRGETTKKGIGYGIVNALEWKKLPWVKEIKQPEQAVMAFVDDDGEHVDKILGNLRRKYNGDMKQVNSQLRSVIKEKYLGGDISRSEAEKALSNLVGDDDDTVYWSLKEWDNPSAEFGKYDSFYDAIESGSGIQSAVDELLNHGADKKSVASRITSEFKAKYVELYDSDPTAAKELRKKLLDAYEALGYDRDDKYDDIADWVK